MASMPPQPPGGGAPPPPPGQPPYGAPFGQRDYWRFQKEQNKAAWRAQRDTWRAQRDMLRAQSRASRVPSITGPILLISIGIVALLVITGQIQAYQFWDWYRRWWPLLLIGIGVVALAEWAIDLRSEQPRTRRFGGVGLVVLLVILGIVASAVHTAGEHWDKFSDYDEDSPNPFFGFFHAPPHELDQPVLESTIPANAQIEVRIPRGDVSISTSDDSKMQVIAHQVVYAANDTEAKRRFDAQQAHVTVSGNAVVVKVDNAGNDAGHTNLTIKVPASASVTVNSESGNLTVAGLGGNVDATLRHGNLDAASITGYVHGRMSHGGNFSAHDINADVSVDGDGHDLTLSDIHGKVILQGEYTGDIHVEHIDQSVHFHSERTDMELGRLPGDFSMSLSNLHVTQVAGPIRVTTHSKDIEMSQVYGDVNIQNRDGRVELDMAGSYNVEVKNNKGDVAVSLPPSAGVVVEGGTHNGEISSEFPLTISGDQTKSISGTIGKGGPRLSLNTQNADLDIRKGTEPEPIPGASKAIAAPSKAPVTPPGGAKHLTAPKGEKPEEPVQQ